VQDALQGHTLYPIVALALGTGMRRGELLAIQWGDIDLDSATLQVKRSLEETSAGLRLKEPKSDAGWRTVTLSAATVRVRSRTTRSFSLISTDSHSSLTPSAAHGGASLRPKTCPASRSTACGTHMPQC
jgi:integrase